MRTITLRWFGAAGDTRANRTDVGAQRARRGRIRLAPSTNRDVDCRDPTHGREQLEARELAQTPLESVAIDGRVLMTRHDDSDTRKSERGSENPHVEVHGPNSLPLSNDGL